MDDCSPQSIFYEVARPSYELKGEGPQSLPQAEILTNTNQNYMQNQSNTLVIEELEGLLSV